MFNAAQAYILGGIAGVVTFIALGASAIGIMGGFVVGGAVGYLVYRYF